MDNFFPNSQKQQALEPTYIGNDTSPYIKQIVRRYRHRNWFYSAHMWSANNPGYKTGVGNVDIESIYLSENGLTHREYGTFSSCNMQLFYLRKQILPSFFVRSAIIIFPLNLIFPLVFSCLPFKIFPLLLFTLHIFFRYDTDRCGVGWVGYFPVTTPL